LRIIAALDGQVPELAYFRATTLLAMRLHDRSGLGRN
jgi:hypothetical protein